MADEQTLLTPGTEATAPAAGGTDTTPTSTTDGGTGTPNTPEATEGGEAAPKTGEEAGKQDQTAQQGPPETYEWKFPEGMTADDALVAEFEPLAREHGLGQEAAQKFLELGIKAQQKYEADARERWARDVAGWAKAVRADQELGGPESDQKVAIAVEAVRKFGTPDLRALFGQWGIGNHPELVRAFYRIGMATREDSHASPSEPAGDRLDPANLLYGGSR